ncbi:hypothetical protein [Noviherbaspirillum soli]|uniref:hypothetical protein n=1 Tax=Noviherbaspirillum soli TaxID=1064518 RepID=UPI00188D6CB1|nr:hypothetical protein [Noviherbaspirillum soli]
MVRRTKQMQQGIVGMLADSDGSFAATRFLHEGCVKIASTDNVELKIRALACSPPCCLRDFLHATARLGTGGLSGMTTSVVFGRHPKA